MKVIAAIAAAVTLSVSLTASTLPAESAVADTHKQTTVNVKVSGGRLG